MKSLLTLAFALLAFIPTSNAMEGHAVPAEAVMPVIKAVVFHSDNCGGCKILKPKMMKAMQAVNMSKIEMVKLDFTSKETIEASKALAEDKNVSGLLQKFGAKTGFVTLLNSNGDIVETLNSSDSAQDIAAKLAKAIVDAS